MCYVSYSFSLLPYSVVVYLNIYTVEFRYLEVVKNQKKKKKIRQIETSSCLGNSQHKY